MSWEKWVLIGLVVLASLLSVAQIGKARTPVTPGLAVASLIFNSAFVALVVFA